MCKLRPIFSSSTGSFEAFNLPALTSGLVWNVSELLTSGELSAIADVDLNDEGWITGNGFC